jgi:SPX domain protein involved in polyphosphate accumulation
MTDFSWRFEQKMVLNGFSHEKIISELSLHQARFEKAFPDRQVNNLYLDTESLTCFYDHMNGSGKRFKARIRWYGHFTNHHNSNLEIKLRQGSVSSKRVYPLQLQSMPSTRKQWSDVLKNSKACESRSETLHFLRPILFNRYLRSYWQSLRGNIRLTVDSAIQYRQRSSNFWVSEGDHVQILELKYSAKDAVLGKQILKNFSERPDRSSKYMRGILKTQIT